jgi:hypothetical protein
MKFIYKVYNGISDLPSSYSDSRFDSLASFVPSGTSGSHTISDNLSSDYRYIVAGFVMDANGVWSLDFEWDTVSTPLGTDTIPPQPMDIVLSLEQIHSRAVRLIWSVDSAALAIAMENESDQLMFAYGFSTDGPDVFSDSLNPYHYIYFVDAFDVAVAGSVVVDQDLDPNEDYFFAIVPADSARNTALPHGDGNSVDVIRTSIQNMDSSECVISTPSNTQFIVDWSNALTMTAADTFYAKDSLVEFCNVIVTDTGYYRGLLPADDIIIRGDTIFYSKISTLDKLSMTIDYFGLDTADYYVSIFVMSGGRAYPSDSAAALGVVHYTLDNPWLDSLTFRQLNDSLLMVQFIPMDLTEDTIAIKTSFDVNDAYAGRNLSLAVVDTSFMSFPSYTSLALDTLLKGQLYTAFIRLNATELDSNVFLGADGRGTDSDTLFFKISMNDRMPVSDKLYDTNTVFSLVVDRKPPYFSDVRISYDRFTQDLLCSLSSGTQGDLSSVMWGVDTDSLGMPIFVDTLSYDSLGRVLVFDTTGVLGIYLRLRDSLGNVYDTSWRDFDFVRVKFNDSLGVADSGRIVVDNGNAMVLFTVNSLDAAAMREAYLWIGLDQMVGAEASAFRDSNRLGAVYSTQYWFLTEFSPQEFTKPTPYKDGLKFKFYIDTSEMAFDMGLRLYRRYPNGMLEYLGGIADTLGYIWIDRYKMMSYWNSYYAPDSLDWEDSIKVVIALDTVHPVIDMDITGLVFDAGDSTGMFILRVSDNNIYLDAGIEVFTFSDGVRTVVWDTVTTSLNSGTRLRTGPVPDTVVVCTLDFSDSVKVYYNQIDSNGLYCAFYVDDGLRRYFYNSYPVLHDSLSGVFSSVTEKWKVVNITGRLSRGSDIVSSLRTFKGKYYRDRFRLYGLRGHGFVEYSDGDTLFDISPGRSYLLISRYSDDDNVRFRTGSATSSYLKSDRGYVVASGGKSGQWHLVNLPFMGTIEKSAIVDASVESADTTRVALAERIWQYDGTSRAFEPVAQADDFKSVQGYSEGFLVYLYKGDTLIVPITDAGAYLFAKRSVLSKALKPKGAYYLDLSLSSFDSLGYHVIDNFNRFGVSGHIDKRLPDVLMPGASYAVGFKEKGGLMSYSSRKNDNKGKLWRVCVNGLSSKSEDLALSLRNMAQVPSEYLIYLDNPVLGYSVDLRKSEGMYHFYSEGRKRHDFTILVGDSAFVLSRISRPVPLVFAMQENYPNPFNPVTTIKYQVPDFSGGRGISKTRLYIDVYNIRGQSIGRIADGVAKPGYHRVRWMGISRNGKPVASGMYVYRITVKDHKGNLRFSKIRKMMLIK